MLYSLLWVILLLEFERLLDRKSLFCARSTVTDLCEWKYSIGLVEDLSLCYS